MKAAALLIAALSSSAAHAYNIGGEFATLQSCEYGSWGYQYGNIGTYRTMSGETYRIFFGSSYCQP